jgi:hypothetical protein
MHVFTVEKVAQKVYTVKREKERFEIITSVENC